MVFSEDQGGLGPFENNPEQASGARRLLIWAVLLVLAIASPSLSPSSWGGLVALWGWTPLLVGAAAAWTVIGFGGHPAGGDHTRCLEGMPLRVFADGRPRETGPGRLLGGAPRPDGRPGLVETDPKTPGLRAAS